MTLKGMFHNSVMVSLLVQQERLGGSRSRARRRQGPQENAGEVLYLLLLAGGKPQQLSALQPFGQLLDHFFL